MVDLEKKYFLAKRQLHSDFHTSAFKSHIRATLKLILPPDLLLSARTKNMRFAYFLVVSTATVLSTSSAIALTSVDDQAKVPAVTAADAAVAVRALDISHDKRFLRSNEKNDENAEYEEERGLPLGKLTQLTKKFVGDGQKIESLMDKLSSLFVGLSAKNRQNLLKSTRS